MEVLRAFPWREALLRGVLGADVIGVHTDRDAARLLRAAAELLGASVGSDHLTLEGRRVTVQVNPISVDTELFEAARTSPAVQAAAQALREDIGTRIVLGVDRMDYSKGLPERLRSFEAYLETYPDARGQLSLLQIAAPSRDDVPEYAAHRLGVEALVEQINGRYASGNWRPVHYLHRSLSPDELAVHYAAADVMLVTPLKDGLNLVAKEFACTSETGTLILSEFAGAGSGNLIQLLS